MTDRSYFLIVIADLPSANSPQEVAVVLQCLYDTGLLAGGSFRVENTLFGRFPIHLERIIDDDIAVLQHPESLVSQNSKTVDRILCDQVLLEVDNALDEVEIPERGRYLDATGRALDGNPIKPGDVFKTGSGRSTTPYPKQKSEKYRSQWLIDNAVAEAQARNNSFAASMFENTTLLKGGHLTMADKDSMLEYLTGDQDILGQKPIPMPPRDRAERILAEFKVAINAGLRWRPHDNPVTLDSMAELLEGEAETC